MRNEVRARRWRPAWLLLCAALVCAAGPAHAQSAVPAPAAAPPPESRPKIPPPRHFAPDAPAVGRVRIAAASRSGAQEPAAAPSVPVAAALPVGPAGAGAGPDASVSASLAPPPRLPLDTTLIPGRVIQPIDLANALKLAGATELDIATARQRILQAAANLSQARAPLAAVAVLRADLVSVRWPDPDGHRPGPDD